MVENLVEINSYEKSCCQNEGSSKFNTKTNLFIVVFAGFLDMNKSLTDRF